MELDFLQILSLLIVFVSLLLAIFLLTLKSENYLSNSILALFLIISAQDSDSIFIAQFVYPQYPALGMLINSTVFLKMPFLFLYILSVTQSGFKFKWKHLFHALPFLIINMAMIPQFYGVGYEEQIKFLQGNSLFERQPVIRFSYILIHAQILAYVVASFMVIGRYRKLQLENFSNASLFNYKWLFQFMVIFTIESLVASLKNLFMFLGWEMPFYYSMIVTSTLALAYIIWIVMKALKHPQLFKGIDPNLQLVRRMVRAESEHKGNVVRTINLNREINQKLKELNEYMINEEPYLDPSLTIYDLSKQIGMPAKDLSMFINHDLNQHFFDFVNGFRIRKAMELLGDPVKKEFTILEILYEVGFNSKSSFNTAFKKYTQLTPTEYRKKHLSSAA